MLKHLALVAWNFLIGNDQGEKYSGFSAAVGLLCYMCLYKSLPTEFVGGAGF